MSAPAIGAKIGPVPLTSIKSEKKRVKSGLLNRSLAMAREMTTPKLPADPCTKRSAINELIVLLNAHHTDTLIYSSNPISSGVRRPCISLRGPATSCPRESPIIQAVRLSCANEGVAAKSLASDGKAGKYISSEIGASAARAPKMIAMVSRSFERN